ncbi:hypothetical protein D8674_001864 [Pyrus ussuriensis x Pyrus communis]|uniref:DUF506 family protein n=1 Tax=Pyrus ussuriensis x Pyrus communis TaxID=2448454 RepID=A0A5N5FCL6_9ROSA|nr:hypothetical protein D8674_001864 [Pyrus ussuriensis x Pyrus communis]
MGAVRFQRVAAAFDEVSRVRLCESSGSEYSAAGESFADLSDLVKSFIERGDLGESGGDRDGVRNDEESEGGDWSDSETKNSLERLFEVKGDDLKKTIADEVEVALAGIGDDKSSRGFKRRLMTHLRYKGFDAGLCKSKWVKSSLFPAGDYEFVDVNLKGTRYVVEPSLVGQFEIARPTTRYTSLLEVFPNTFVGEVDELKKIVRLMCTAIKKSMKSVDMPMPPWRRNGYMQAKWFGSYKRTTNAVAPLAAANTALESNHGFGGVKKSMRLEALPTKSYYCRGDFASKDGLRVGRLTAAFQGG